MSRKTVLQIACGNSKGSSTTASTIQLDDADEGVTDRLQDGEQATIKKQIERIGITAHGRVATLAFGLAFGISALVLVGSGSPAGAQSTPEQTGIEIVNEYRDIGGLPALSENAIWSDGASKHSRYMVGNGAITHSEDPSKPFYTVEGDAAGRAGVVTGKGSQFATDRELMDRLITAPFHALLVLDPKLTSTGYGAYRDASASSFKSGATLDVSRGRTGTAPTAPVMFPSNGKASPLLSYDGGEVPDPLASCAGYAAPTGAPVLVQLPEAPVKTAAAIVDNNGVTVESCVYDEHTAVTGRSELGDQHAVVIIPRQPLTDLSTYSVRVRTCARDLAWSFGTDAGRTGYSPIPAPTPIVLMPIGCTVTTPPIDGGGGTVVPKPPPNTAPVVIPRSPRPGSKVNDTTPRITAIVRDRETNLVKRNVKLYVDGKRITRYSYSPATDQLTATSRKLKAGKRHTVKIVATDALRKSTAKTWSFMVLKRR